MADVFLSYKRDERAAVEQISSRLKALGLSVWFDAGISAGESFNSEIDREARSARAVLVCWSPGARDSEWVAAEAMIGFAQKKLAACYISGPATFDPPTPFNAYHAEDLRDWLVSPDETHPAWKSVLRRLGKLCGRSDIESWGRLSDRSSASELRDWITRHPESPLVETAKLLLIAQGRDVATQWTREHAGPADQRQHNSVEVDGERSGTWPAGLMLLLLTTLAIGLIGFILSFASQASGPPQVSQDTRRTDSHVTPSFDTRANGSRSYDISCRDLANASYPALTQRFGASNVRNEDIDIGEGNRYPATVVFGDDQTRRIEFIRTPENAELWQVRVAGESSLWRGPAGLALGQTIPEVEAINGTPFFVTGWGWDYGGRGHDWREGVLSRSGCRIFLDFLARRPAPAGDQDYPSDSSAVRSADAVLQRIILSPS